MSANPSNKIGYFEEAFRAVLKIEQGYEAPFDKLQVVNVTYVNSELVEVELHLSELQHRQNKEYKLGVFN